MTPGRASETSLPENTKTIGNNRNRNDISNGRKKTVAMSQKAKGAPDRIQCPCHNYTALSKIVDIITSGDRSRTDSMIEWLNGGTDQVAIREQKLLTCGKRFKCRYRYGTSFEILRAIRKACAPFQAVSTATGDSGSATSPKGNTRTDSMSFKHEISSKKDKIGPKSYDQSFPPLSQHPGASNILMPPRKKQDKTTNFTASNKTCSSSPTINTLTARKKKPKKRVQTLLTEASTSNSPNPAFAANTATKIITNHETKLVGKTKDHADTEQNGSKRLVHASGIMTTIEESKRDQLALEVVEAPSLDSTITPNIGEAKPPDPPSKTLQKADLLRLPSKSPNDVTDTAIEQMDRLVDIYIALMENMLVPSTPLEIHLLLELLLLDTSGGPSNLGESPQRDILQEAQKSREDSDLISVTSKSVTSKSVTGSPLFFQPILYDPERCIAFAQNVMQKYLKGVIQRLSPFLIKSLLEDRVFVRRCPTVAEQLNKLLLTTTTAIEWTPPAPESITGTHAIFSLPFEPDRDSRHNFKTPAEISMYQNRELTRDAFLSQLRDFITAKSKKFLPAEVDQVREKAQFESRKIINNISSHNMVWFAQFFCDLLLQVGLAPVEEMDQELLQIADDKDKLQKLHKRFFKKNPSRSSHSRATFGSSTTTSHRTERNRNFSVSRNESKSSTMAAFQEALPYFPGYQEFFFIFLYSVNSYSFGMHLLHQIVKKTSDMISNHTLNGLEKRTLDLGLLARFLGCLIFSPNWHEENIELNKLKPCIHSLDHGINLLDSIGLPVSKLVQESWDGGYTFLVIPWVTELLKMSKWDSISQSSMKFRQTLANLRFIQCIASQSNSKEYKAYGSNMQQVFFHLETFFNGTFSLPKLTSLPNATLVPLAESEQNSLDNHKIGLSTVAINASSPHMENLCDMIMISTKVVRREMKSPGVKPRKLKPSIVSPTVGKEAYLGIESPRGKLFSSTSRTRKGDSVDNSLYGKHIHAVNKLTEGFFHQHRDLKEICDFVVQQTLKSLSLDEIRPFVTKASEEVSIGSQSTDAEIEEMQASAFGKSQEFLRKKLENALTKSLELFCQTDMQRGVIDVATNLATNRGVDESHVLVRELIASSTKSILKRMEDATPAPNQNGVKEKSDIDQAMESATKSIQNLTENQSLLSDENAAIEHLEEVLGRVELVTKSVVIPSEGVLRAFFECILGLNSIAELVFERVAKSSSPESWIALKILIRLLDELSQISGYWRIRLNNLFGYDLVHLISNSEVLSSSEKETVLKKLREISGESKTTHITKNSDDGESKYVGIINPKAIQFN